jgi:hypothetical protein
MEPNRFDGLTRKLGKHSRRATLGVAAVGALTALLPRRAGAVCTPQDCDATFPCGFKACNKIQCRTVFSPAGTVCRAAVGPCDVAEVCTGASLTCPTDRQAPNGTPCPGTANPCTEGICQNGQCTDVPKPNGTACPDDGNPCREDLCQNGACVHPNKPDGTGCGPGKVCQVGACRCAPGSDTCGKICTELQSDPSNCGSCGRVCGSGRDCCRGECAKLSSDVENCGRCGKRCRRGQRCRGGRCRKS